MKLLKTSKLFVASMAVVGAGVAGILCTSSNTYAATTTLKAGDRIGYVGSGVDLCTVAAVGTDSLGNKLALTAGHCVAVGQRMTRLNAQGLFVPANQRTEIGVGAVSKITVTGATQPNKLDYGFVKLDNDVELVSTGRSSVAAPVLWQSVTRIGNDLGFQVNQQTNITGYTTNDFTIAGSVAPGASGGPVVADDKLVGVASRAAIFYGLPITFVTRADAAIADVSSTGGIGTDFKPL